MNKQEIKKLVDCLNLPKGEFSILSSGSLVLRGIQETANDLDLHISDECFNYVQNHFKITFMDPEHKYNNPLYRGKKIIFF